MAPRFNIAFKRWRFPRVLWALIIIELPLTVAALTLYGIADPNTYRTRLWRDGSYNGFNSDPATPLYAAANYQTVKIPLVWSSYLTQFNLVISVLSMFILLVKSAMVPLHVLWPFLSLPIHILELGIYAFSVYGQTSPDTIDPKHSNTGPPWYITKSCSVAALKSNVGYCRQAKASFYVAVLLVALFSVHILLAVHSMLWAPSNRLEDDDGESTYSTDKGKGTVRERQQWEMTPIPESKNPMTPRTTAFNALGSGGALPLREQFPPPPTKPVKQSRFG